MLCNVKGSKQLTNLLPDTDKSSICKPNIPLQTEGLMRSNRCQAYCPPLLTNLRFVSKAMYQGEDLSVKGGSQYQGEDLSVSGVLGGVVMMLIWGYGLPP